MQAAARLVNRPPLVVPAAAVVQRLASNVQCQGLRVSSPADPAEVEARRVARSIVNMPAAAPAISRSPVMPQRAETAATAVASPALPGGGAALPESVRSFMEPRFRADFSRVRIHTDGRADAASRQIQARAFTVGERIYFAGGQFRPETAEGRELIAHELTHTIQQGAAPQAIQRSPETAVSERSGEQLQRWGLPSLPNPRQYIAGKASSIRGFDFMTMVIGCNPITDARVDSSPAGLLREGVKLMPGGGTIAQALDNHQIFDKAGAWISGKFAALKKLAGNIKRAVGDFIGGIEVDDMLNPGAVWQRGKALLVGFVDSVGSYVGGLVEDVVSFIKDAILKPIAAHARGTQGYPLLCSVLGKDPISGDKAPQDADAYLGGFMTFIGEQETWGNMKKANAVPRAFAWFKGAASALKGFVQEIPTLFLSTLKSLGIADLVFIPRAFIKLGKVFAGFAGRFIGWGANAVFKLLEIVLDSVKPGLMGYIRRTGGAIRNILRNPAPFAGNLVSAGIQGFRQFAGNFVTHLKAGLLEWLTGAMPGVHIPASFELKEILRFVLSVLGISWKNIRAKLVRLVGEGPVKAMETGFDIVLTLVRDGPAAAWDKIKEQLGSLKDMVIGGITSFVVDTVVKKAVPKVVAMFVPGAGFIAAAISIYDSIMVFVSKLARIAAVVGAFVSSIAQIAAGNIAGAAKRIESVLAGLLSLTISFLAGFAGLGKVADKVMGVIAKVRAPIDKALDWLVAWIVRLGRRFMGVVRGAAGSLLQWWRMRRSFSAGRETHSLYFSGEEDNAELTVASSPRRLDAYVAEARSNRTTPAAQAALDRIQTQIQGVRDARTQLRAARRANRPESEQQVHVTAIENALAAIGVELGGLLAGEESGKRVAPIDIAWPKPAWSAYPPLYLYRGSGATPWHLTARPDSSRPFVRQYRPTGSHVSGDTSAGPPPAELDSLGIGGEYRIQPNELVGPLSEHGTPGGAALNNLLARYGWSASAEDMDGDHVKEIQFGGRDVLANLWPLRAGVNRGAGSTLSRAPVQLGTEPVTVDILKRVRLTPADQGEGKFTFKIRSVS